MPRDDYRLVWSDEFGRAGRPDPRNWTCESGFLRNHEHQWYQPENATVRGGRLVIEARRERKLNPKYKAGADDWRAARPFAEYTSACLISRGLREFQYGRFELRARIDTRSGLWPAIWTLGVEGEWPACGEIDIMEFYRGDLLANVAWGTDRRWVGAWNAQKRPVAAFGDRDWSRKFHTWRMDWTDEAIRLSVDDTLLNETPLARTLNGDAARKNPFRQPHYLLLNLAVGGDNGGDPTSTTFPARYEIDYARVYQKAS